MSAQKPDQVMRNPSVVAVLAFAAATKAYDDCIATHACINATSKGHIIQEAATRGALAIEEKISEHVRRRAVTPAVADMLLEILRT